MIINKQEYKCLLEIVSKKNISLDDIDFKEINGGIEVNFSNEEIEGDLFEGVTEMLLLVGFDNNYEVTHKGLILESLIDKFNKIGW